MEPSLRFRERHTPTHTNAKGEGSPWLPVGKCPLQDSFRGHEEPDSLGCIYAEVSVRAYQETSGRNSRD